MNKTKFLEQQVEKLEKANRALREKLARVEGELRDEIEAQHRAARARSFGSYKQFN